MRASRLSTTDTTVLLAEPPPWWLATLALVVALVVQSSVAPLLAVRGGVVSVVTLVAVWFALRTGPSAALAYGAILGAGEDALAPTGAVWTVTTALLTLTISLVRTRVAVDRLAVVFGVLVAATFARTVAALAGLALEGRAVPALALHLHAAVWQSLLTAGVGSLALAIFPRIGTARGRY